MPARCYDRVQSTETEKAPPSLKEGFDISLPKKKGKSNSSQPDWVNERDLRKLGDAFKEINLRSQAGIGCSGPSATEEQIFAWACEIAGISIKRGLEVQKLGREWPTEIERETTA